MYYNWIPLIPSSLIMRFSKCNRIYHHSVGETWESYLSVQICNPRQGLQSPGCCKSSKQGQDTLVLSAGWWLNTFLLLAYIHKTNMGIPIKNWEMWRTVRYLCHEQIRGILHAISLLTRHFPSKWSFLRNQMTLRSSGIQTYDLPITLWSVTKVHIDYAIAADNKIGTKRCAR